MRDFRALQGVGAALFLAVAYGLMSSHGSGADQRPARRSYARRSARTPGEYLSASAGPTMTRDAAGAYSPPPAFIAAPRLPSTARRGLGAVAPPPPPSAPGAPARGRAAGAA
ncbi:MAG TPA: hypothetical protein VNI01_06505, partial [Elusimicrobiota bacterium]|nr:hypothetical protein [Elusimicrobiota bacterium]